MAEQPIAFSYHNIELYKTESLGSGSYGGVCKAKCDGLLCAAKIMHPTLFDHCDPGAASYLRKFQEECHVLSLARHPNVVQYLATCYDPDTRLPVLLMELCDESLTAFLERSPGPLSYHVQVNICHDIALALVYLHSNGLIHRDLTGNNVLMIAGPRTKITDFGMSKLTRNNPRVTAYMFCPGNAVYMPPEALDEAKLYTDKLDTFSFGVVVIQILTRQFPDPTNRFFIVCSSVNSGKDEDREIRQLIPDTERRHAHLQLISDTHSLKPIALQCLKKNESLRPSAVQLSERLSELKQSSQYTESVHQALHKLQLHHERDQLQTQIAAPESKVANLDRQIKAKERMLQLLHEEDRLHQAKPTPDQAEEMGQRELQQMQQQLQASEQLVSQFQQTLEQNNKIITELRQTILTRDRKIQQLEQQDIASRDQPQHDPVAEPQTTLATAQKDISSMTWREGKDAPEGMARGAAIVHRNTAYFRPANSCKMFSYHGEQWSQLPDNPYINYSLAIIDGLLTSVGGKLKCPTNSLFSLTGEGASCQWSKIFPPMATPRSSAACVTHGPILITIGGKGSNNLLNTVEVFNNKQWSTISPFLQPLALLSGVVCGDILYLAGGLRDDYEPSKSVFTCSLHDLVMSSRSRMQQTLSPNHKMWMEISSLPVAYSTLISFNGEILAIGGRYDSRDPTINIYKYDSLADSWTVASQMNNKRSYCLAVPLCKRLIVVGGHNTRDLTSTENVEILE